MRVLLIEDDAPTAQAVSLLLQSDGHQVETGTLGAEVADRVARSRFDLIILDLGLPDMSGTDVIRHLRAKSLGTPVVVLSGTSEVAAKVHALGGGADDYVTKPFHDQELLARLSAIARRAAAREERSIRAGPLTINLDNHDVEVDGTRVHLTASEFALLEALALRKGTTMTKGMLLEQLYGGRDEPEVKIIDVFVCKIRKKLGDAGLPPDYIETAWGRGYRLRDSIDAASAVLSA